MYKTLMVYPHRAEAQRNPWTYEAPINGHAYCDHWLSAELALEPTKAAEPTIATRTAITA